MRASEGVPGLILNPFKFKLLRGLACAPELPVLGLANTAEIGRAFGFALGDGAGNPSPEGVVGNDSLEPDA